MNYQSTGRNPRAKSFKVKQALQFALLLAVCIWLLYQITPSHEKRKDYGGSAQGKLSQENGGVLLGRKGNAGWFSDGGESDTGDVKVVGEGDKKEDGGGGDDELDRSAEENSEEEFFHKYSENRHGNFTTRAEKEDRNVSKNKRKESQNNGHNSSDGEVGEGNGAVVLNKDMPKEEYFSDGHENSHGIVLGSGEHEDEMDPKKQVSHDEQGDDKDPEIQAEESPFSEEDNTDTQVQEKYETVGSYKEKDEGKEPTKFGEKIAMQLQPSAVENVTFNGQSDMVNGILGFHDENGVQQDGNDLIDFILNEPSDDQANIPPHETVSSLNNQSRIFESMPIEVKEVAFKEGSSTADVVSKAP